MGRTPSLLPRSILSCALPPGCMHDVVLRAIHYYETTKTKLWYLRRYHITSTGLLKKKGCISTFA